MRPLIWMAGAMALVGGLGTLPARAAEGSAAAGSAAAGYEAISPSELSCSFTSNGRIDWAPDGSVSASGIKISCEGKDLALVSDKTKEGGFVQTRDYGDLLVKSNGGFPPALSLWAKPSQKEALKKLKSK